MTNFMHFEKPVIHFGNAHEDRSEPSPIVLPDRTVGASDE